MKRTGSRNLDHPKWDSQYNSRQISLKIDGAKSRATENVSHSDDISTLKVLKIMLKAVNNTEQRQQNHSQQYKNDTAL